MTDFETSLESIAENVNQSVTNLSATLKQRADLQEAATSAHKQLAASKPEEAGSTMPPAVSIPGFSFNGSSPKMLSNGVRTWSAGIGGAMLAGVVAVLAFAAVKDATRANGTSTTTPGTTYAGLIVMAGLLIIGIFVVVLGYGKISLNLGIQDANQPTGSASNGGGSSGGGRTSTSASASSSDGGHGVPDATH